MIYTLVSLLIFIYESYFEIRVASSNMATTWCSGQATRTSVPSPLEWRCKGAKVRGALRNESTRITKRKCEGCEAKVRGLSNESARITKTKMRGLRSESARVTKQKYEYRKDEGAQTQRQLQISIFWNNQLVATNTCTWSAHDQIHTCTYGKYIIKIMQIGILSFHANKFLLYSNIVYR